MAPLRMISVTLRLGTILIGLLFFAIPIYASSIFAFRESDGSFSAQPISSALENHELVRSFFLTMQIAFGTVLLTLLLLIPTIAYLHFVIPGARAWVEFLTLTPLVIPPIVQGVGFLYSMPTSLKSTPYALIFAYTVLALPFSYRAIDSAFSSIDVRTLFNAASSLGANFMTVVSKILIPNVAAGIFAAIFLTIALVLGEFAYASLLLWDTFPTVLAVAGMSNASTAVALSILSLIGVWLILSALSAFNRRSRGLIVSGV